MDFYVKKPHFNLTIVGLLVGLNYLLSCTQKSDTDDLILKGRIQVDEGIKDGVLIIGATNKPFEKIIGKPAEGFIKSIATKDFTSYELRIPRKLLGDAQELQVIGFIDRDFEPTKAPKITKGDLIGFALTGIRPGVNIAETGKAPLYADLNIDRVARGRDVSITFELSHPDPGRFLAGLYCDDIRGLSIKQFDARDVAFIQPFELKKPTETFTMNFPLFQAKETEQCFLFATKDTNRNLAVDPGESFGFFTNRKDKLPALIDLKDPNSSPYRIDVNQVVQKGNEATIVVKGRIEAAPELNSGVKRYYVIAVKYIDGSFSPENIVKNIVGFTQIDTQSESYEIDITESSIRPGDEVTVFALGDQSDQGIPSLDDGDAIGLAIEDQSVLRRKIQSGVNIGFDVKLKQRFFDGKAKINVQMESDYTGPIMLVGYRGNLSLDLASIDTTQIVGFSSFQKSEKKASTALDIYSLGEKWPLKLYVIGILDANRNQRIDPGEIVQLPLNRDGQPEPITIQNGDILDYKLTYLFTTQVPGSQNLNLSGRLHLNSNVEAPYIHILVAQGNDPNQFLKDPLRFVKAAIRVPSAARRYQIPLTNTSLKPGDKVQIMAVTGENGEDFPRLSERTLVGTYTGKTQGHTLSSGENRDLDIVIDRNVYTNVVSILGSLENSYRGSVIASLYKGDPIDLLNQKFRFSDFIAFSKINKENDNLDVKFDTLLSNQRLPLSALPILIEDKNGNDYPDPGETVHYSLDPTTKNPLLLRMTTSFVRSFRFDESRTIAQKSPVEATLSGRVLLQPSGEDSRIFVLILDSALQSMAPDQIAKHVRATQRVSASAPNFSIDLANVGIVPGEKILIAALADRDVEGFPQLSPNDILGFYADGDSFLYTVKNGINGPIQISIDRTVYEGKSTIEGSIIGSNRENVLVVAYQGDIESMTKFEPDPRQILGFASTGGSSHFEVDVNPFGASFPTQAYIFGVIDTNGNQALDPGETLYYFSERSDRIPEKVSINKGQRINLNLNQKMILQLPAHQDIKISGSIKWPRNASLPDSDAFLFVARGKSIDDIRMRPIDAIRYLERLEGRPSNYSISLEETNLVPGDEVFVGAWIDADHSLSLSPGDKLGIFIEGLKSYSLKLNEKEHVDIDIPVELTMYPTNKSLTAAFYGTNYTGPVIAGVLSGSVKSLRLEDIEPSMVASFVSFQKTSRVHSFDMDLLPTVPLPIDNATVFALMDANGNGRADPGEQIGFSSAMAGSFPRSFAISSNFNQTVSINSFFRIPQPSGQTISVRGKIDSNFPTSDSNFPTLVAIFQDASIDKLTKDPMAYLKAFTVLEAGSSSFSLNLSHSDLRLGDRVTVLAFQNPSEQRSQQLQLSEGARVGILLNMNRLEIVKTLVDADQDLNSDEFGLVLKRKYYQHDGRFEVKFGGVIPMVEGDSIGIGAYRIDLNQPLSQLASIDYDQVIALYRGTFNPGQTYDVPIFPALIPGIVNESRKISGLAIIGWKDMNKDGKVDHFEPVGIYSDALLGGTPTLVTLALTLNQLPGAIMMGGSAQTPAAAGSLLRGH